MKTKTEEPTVPHLKYPILAKHNGDGYIVMFTELTKGVVVHNPSNVNYSLGHYADNWIKHTDASVWTILPVGTRIILEQE